MPTGRQGSIHLFRFSGVDVFLHWSWFLVAVYEIQSRKGGYSSIAWNVLEYLALFLIVTLHEFGHALACRQVGGRADRIVLWPLGGVAYVDPPPRPGATLWSIAAGPLVNVALVPVFALLLYVAGSQGWGSSMPRCLPTDGCGRMDKVGCSIFNIIPIYPLDGGQILRALLWFMMGRAWSLMVAAVIGLIGAAGFVDTRGVPPEPLARRNRCVYPYELLGRIQERAGVAAASRSFHASWICLPNLQDCAAAGTILEMRQLRASV